MPRIYEWRRRVIWVLAFLFLMALPAVSFTAERESGRVVFGVS